MQARRVGKARRVAFFILLVVMLAGLHMLGTMVQRPIPWWLDLGWLGLSGWMCRVGWNYDEDQRPVWTTYPPMRRLGYAATLAGGVLMCWIGWIGWRERETGSIAGMLVIFLPVGALWLLWLAGRLFVKLMKAR